MAPQYRRIRYSGTMNSWRYEDQDCAGADDEDEADEEVDEEESRVEDDGRKLANSVPARMRYMSAMIAMWTIVVVEEEWASFFPGVPAGLKKRCAR